MSDIEETLREADKIHVSIKILLRDFNEHPERFESYVLNSYIRRSNEIIDKLRSLPPDAQIEYNGAILTKEGEIENLTNVIKEVEKIRETRTMTPGFGYSSGGRKRRSTRRRKHRKSRKSRRHKRKSRKY